MTPTEGPSLDPPTLDMTMSDGPSPQEFGVLIGEVRGIRQQVADLQRTNSAEHAANAKRMERIEGKLETGLEKKADRADLHKLDEKVDGLELDRAGTRARDNLLKGGLGAVVTLAAVVLGDHLHL